jgi:hypothetical protein
LLIPYKALRSRTIEICSYNVIPPHPGMILMP